MKAIIIKSKVKTWVDDEDFEYLNQWTWGLSSGYVRRIAYKPSKSYKIYLHRLITKAQDGEIVDHINHNLLDNRKTNLRICTKAQNSMNQYKQSRNTSSKYKGVSLYKANGRFEAYIKYNNKKINLGRYVHEEDAANAYNQAAKKMFGEFANLNYV